MEKPEGLIRHTTSDSEHSLQEQMTKPPDEVWEAAGLRLAETRTAVTARNREVRSRRMMPSFPDCVTSRNRSPRTAPPQRGGSIKTGARRQARGAPHAS